MSEIFFSKGDGLALVVCEDVELEFSKQLEEG